MMKSFSLQLLFKIIGIGSASGILFHHGSLYLISDNSTFLYRYDVEAAALERIPLAANAAEQIAKANKPDFEVLTIKDDQILIFGSGSTDKRTQQVQFDLKSRQTKTIDISDLYLKMQQTAGIEADEFNIEGAVYSDKVLYLFQRGNGAKKHNGIFRIDEERLTVEYTPITLPSISNIESTFTDAVLVDNYFYFLAAAENSSSTYHDGEVLGSLIGKIDVRTLRLDDTLVITSTNKFEGLSFEGKKNGYLSFLLCEDRDDDLAESAIYRLLLKN